MKTAIFALVFGWAVAGASSIVLAQDDFKSKKLIEWGWDEPDTRFMRDHVATMEQMPFNGLVFHINSNAGINLSWEIWQDRRFEIADFSQAIAEMKSTRFDRLSHRFLRVNVTPGYVDWFDERAWDIVLNNTKIAAILAREGGAKGFMFDVEQYKFELFNEELQKSISIRDRAFFKIYQIDFSTNDIYSNFNDYINNVNYDAIFNIRHIIPPAALYLKVRQRGQEWMNAVAHEFPDIIVCLTFGYTLATNIGLKEKNSHYGLLRAFLDGMLDVVTSRASIVDGYEQSYRYTAKEQFTKAYTIVKNDLAGTTANPDKYRQMIKAAFGLYMDANWDSNGWDVAEPENNYFSPKRLETAVRAALAVSDQYVWVYSEQPNWWARDKLPEAYVDALRNATGLGETQN